MTINGKNSLQGKKILITGGLGFIGSNVVHACVRLGGKVKIYDSLDKNTGGNRFNIFGIEDKIELILKDIRDKTEIRRAVKHQDIIINCAAYTSHPGSMETPFEDLDVNCRGTLILLEAIRKENPSVKLVHLGTSTQIGKMLGNKINELHPEFPMDIYSANKCLSEKYVLIYGNMYGLNTVIVRPTNVFGPRSNIKSSDFGFINYFIGLALQKKKMTIYGNGKQLRNVIYIDDLVELLIRAATFDGTYNNVFFAGSNQQYAIAQIAEEIASVIGGKIGYVKWPENRKRIEIGDVIINNSKIKKYLSWRCFTSLKTGLIKTKRYYKQYLSRYL